jgi:hypothetical protein
MKIVYSHVINRNRGDNFQLHYLELAALSNFLIKKHYPNFETVFYGDKESVEIFKNIKYDRFEILSNNILNQLPRELWTLGKLCTYLQINEPFFHIDFDMLLFKPLPKNCFTKDIVCFHNEYFVNHEMENMQNKVIILPKECANQPSISYNCGIFGGQSIDSIHKSSEIVLNFVIKNKTYIEEMTRNYRQNFNKVPYYYFDISVLIEQVWVFQILKNLNQNIFNLLTIDNWYESYNMAMQSTGYVHLMSERKQKYFNKVKDTLNKLNIKY